MKFVPETSKRRSSGLRPRTFSIAWSGTGESASNFHRRVHEAIEVLGLSASDFTCQAITHCLDEMDKDAKK